MPTAPAFVIDPTGYTQAGKPRVASLIPLDDVWKKAQPGDQLLVLPGNYKRAQFLGAKRPAGSQPVAFIADRVNGNVVLKRDTKVGSTDTLLLKSGQGDAYFEGLALEADDRAGIKTEGPLGSKAVSFKDCQVLGMGSAYDPKWKDSSKWGGHHYLTSKWSEINVTYLAIFEEHARYFHNIQGNHAFSGGSVKHCGRTALQIVNRMSEGPEGKGNVTIDHETVTDACLEQGGGGSAYTFRGGLPNSIVTLDTCVVELGCDPLLAAPFNQNITGGFMMDSAQESKPGKGDGAWPGGTKELHVKSSSFEVGRVFPGVGSARRPNVRVSDCGLFTLENSSIIQHPFAHTIALQIWDTCKKFVAIGTNDVRGQVMYHGQLFQNWALFSQAHPECFA